MAKRVLLSYSDLEAFPDDGLRRELLGGELFVTPSPSPRHQRVVLRLCWMLKGYADKHGGEVFVAPLDVVFGQHDVTEPDVLFLSNERLDAIGDRYIESAPSLVIEVLSPSTSKVDRTRKREVYAQYGVPEYWIVDPVARTIERNADPDGDRYRDTQVFDHAFIAVTLAELHVDVIELLS